MESTSALYRHVAISTAVLAFLTLVSGCGSTARSLIGKRHTPPAKETTELASLTDETPASQDDNDVIRADYQQDSSQPEVALASAEIYDRASVVQADAHVQSATTDPTSFHPFAGTVQHIDTDEFEQQVLNSEVPVLVDFYADWCGPCKKLTPTLKQIASETPNAKVVKVNIDDSPRLAKKYGVRSIPTVMVFKNGSAVARNTGLANKSQLIGMLAQ